MTRTLFFSFCCLVLVSAIRAPAKAEQEPSLTIGSPAPELNIEHWLSDGNGFFEPVQQFQKDKVYVVEFWATWCGPCIMSMPVLAELQNKYRGRGVQVISISDESIDEVQALMSRRHPQANKTFADITSAYSLTTDPDRSTHVAYMDAANQNGIPTSFIVGKSGQIEWIGHPMELDMPLEAIVTDTWDREKFRATYQAKADFEVAMQKISMLAGAGNYGQAIRIADAELAKAKAKSIDELMNQWTQIRFSLKLSSGQIDKETIAYYRDQIGIIKDDPIALARFGYMLYGAHQDGAVLGPLPDDVIKAITASKNEAPEDAQVFLYNTVAQLYVIDKKFVQAVKAQQTAVDAAGDRQKRRLMPFLEELKLKAGISDNEASFEDPSVDESSDQNRDPVEVN